MKHHFIIWISNECTEKHITAIYGCFIKATVTCLYLRDNHEKRFYISSDIGSTFLTLLSSTLSGSPWTVSFLALNDSQIIFGSSDYYQSGTLTFL